MLRHATRHAMRSGFSPAHPLMCHAAAPGAFPGARLRAVTATPRAYQDDTTTVPVNPKASAKFNVYKGKGAMQMSLIGPTWKTGPKGMMYVEREGAMYLEFANTSSASTGVGVGDRTYDWSAKVVFALKANELGNLLDPLVSAKGFDLYHDPGKGTSTEGVMKKTFRVSPVNDDGSQFFSVQQTGMPKVNVPVSMAEQAVIRNLVTFALPRLLGFDMVCNSMHTMDGQGTGQF